MVINTKTACADAMRMQKHRCRSQYHAVRTCRRPDMHFVEMQMQNTCTAHGRPTRRSRDHLFCGSNRSVRIMYLIWGSSMIHSLLSLLFVLYYMQLTSMYYRRFAEITRYFFITFCSLTPNRRCPAGVSPVSVVGCRLPVTN